MDKDTENNTNENEDNKPENLDDLMADKPFEFDAESEAPAFDVEPLDDEQHEEEVHQDNSSDEDDFSDKFAPEFVDEHFSDSSSDLDLEADNFNTNTSSEDEDYEGSEDSFDTDDLDLDLDDLDLDEEELNFDDLDENLSFDDDTTSQAIETPTSESPIKKPSKLVTGLITAAIVGGVTYYGLTSGSSDGNETKASTQAPLPKIENKLTSEAKPEGKKEPHTVNKQLDDLTAILEEEQAEKQTKEHKDVVENKMPEAIVHPAPAKEISKENADKVKAEELAPVADKETVNDKEKLDKPSDSKDNWSTTEAAMIKDMSKVLNEAKSASATVKESESDINSVISKLKEYDKKDSLRTAKIEKIIKTLGKQINSNQKKIDTISREFAINNKLLQSISKNIKNQKNAPTINAEKHDKPMAANKKAPITTPKFDAPSYTVHAIIPGRAWLKNNEGDILTVTDGDMLEGYGKILAIDAPSNGVITSSGIVIR